MAAAIADEGCCAKTPTARPAVASASEAVKARVRLTMSLSN
jgi:hypothetical protein